MQLPSVGHVALTWPTARRDPTWGPILLTGSLGCVRPAMAMDRAGTRYSHCLALLVVYAGHDPDCGV